MCSYCDAADGRPHAPSCPLYVPRGTAPTVVVGQPHGGDPMKTVDFYEVAEC